MTFTWCTYLFLCPCQLLYPSTFLLFIFCHKEIGLCWSSNNKAVTRFTGRRPVCRNKISSVPNICHLSQRYASLGLAWPLLLRFCLEPPQQLSLRLQGYPVFHPSPDNISFPCEISSMHHLWINSDALWLAPPNWFRLLAGFACVFTFKLTRSMNHYSDM